MNLLQTVMLSNKCIYALHAMLELAARDQDGTVTIGQIAQRRDIPERFLEAIMRQLKQAGLADSVRGKAGGYRLARHPARVTVGEIIALIEGPVFVESRRRSDVLTSVWKEAEDALNGVLRRTTFADLVERERQLHQVAAASYSI